MKRRIIRANTQKNYPEAYIQLQRALQEVRHLIDECVDSGLEDYAAWDEISRGLFDGIKAISKACRDADEPVTSATHIVASSGANIRKFIQFDGQVAELEADDWYEAVRIHRTDYAKLSEDVKETIGDLGLLRSEDEEGYYYVDVGERIDFANDEGLLLLERAGLLGPNRKYEVVDYAEVWS